MTPHFNENKGQKSSIKELSQAYLSKIRDYYNTGLY
jgi:hypothetical protein